MPQSASAEEALAVLKGRTGRDDRSEEADQRGPDGRRADDLRHRVGGIPGYGGQGGVRGGAETLRGSVLRSREAHGHQGLRRNLSGAIRIAFRSAGVRFGLQAGDAAVHLRIRGGRTAGEAQDPQGGFRCGPGRRAHHGREVRRRPLHTVHGGLRPGDNGTYDPDVHTADHGPRRDVR